MTTLGFYYLDVAKTPDIECQDVADIPESDINELLEAMRKALLNLLPIVKEGRLGDVYNGIYQNYPAPLPIWSLHTMSVVRPPSNTSISTSQDSDESVSFLRAYNMLDAPEQFFSVSGTYKNAHIVKSAEFIAAEINAQSAKSKIISQDDLIFMRDVLEDFCKMEQMKRDNR